MTKRSSSTPVGGISSCFCILSTMLVRGLRIILVMRATTATTISRKRIVISVWRWTRIDSLPEAFSSSWLEVRIRDWVQRLTFSRMRSL